jgi:hypothetical protein
MNTDMLNRPIEIGDTVIHSASAFMEDKIVVGKVINIENTELYISRNLTDHSQTYRIPINKVVVVTHQIAINTSEYPENHI